MKFPEDFKKEAHHHLVGAFAWKPIGQYNEVDLRILGNPNPAKAGDIFEIYGDGVNTFEFNTGKDWKENQFYLTRDQVNEAIEKELTRRLLDQL